MSAPSPSTPTLSADLGAFLEVEAVQPPSPVGHTSGTPSSSSSSVIPTSADYVDPPKWYRSALPPAKMGNAADLGYGGYTISIAVYSACMHIGSILPIGEGNAEETSSGSSSSTSTPFPPFRIYSASGIFLRPSTIKSRFLTRVALLRDTRTFKTCEVRVYQGDWDRLQLAMTVSVDFMARNPDSTANDQRSILRYSSQPSMEVTHHSELQEDLEMYTSRGDVPPQALAAFVKVFSPSFDNFHSKSPLQSLWVQNLWGILKDTRTTQDDLSLVDRRGYDWLLARRPLRGYAKQAGALAWLMDAAISFAPLSFSHLFLDDAAAASTLSFSLAFHEEDIALDEKWHLREIRTTNGRWERSNGESKLWVDDGQRGEGLRCVATMTQSCILKAKGGQPVSKL